MKKKLIISSFLAIAVIVAVSIVFKVQANVLEISEPIPTQFINTESINNESIKEVDRILEGKTIVLDPGHGGKDVGATGQSGVYEKDIALQTAKNIQQLLLEKTGATVILTRDDDEFLTLTERVRISKEHSADLFISIHYDSSTTNDASGITTYYNKNIDKPLAELVHEQIIKQSMGAKDRGVSYGDYQVLRANPSPSILLELGFISNKEEEQRIQSAEFQVNTSTAIVESIIEYLSQ